MNVRLGGRLLALGLFAALCACGGGSSSPTVAPTPTPIPTPKPVPTPNPEPTPTPDPTATPCTVGLCENPTTNTSPVVRAILKLFQLFDKDGVWVLPTPDPVKQVVKEPIPVGYTIRLDLTGKDKNFADTLGKKEIQFLYSDPTMVEEAIQSDFQRKLKVLKPGAFSVYCTFDGVGSNDLKFTFVE